VGENLRGKLAGALVNTTSSPSVKNHFDIFSSSILAFGLTSMFGFLFQATLGAANLILGGCDLGIHHALFVFHEATQEAASMNFSSITMWNPL
jgi:hypothetical protein